MKAESDSAQDLRMRAAPRHPGTWQSLAGLWCLTWRSQLSWRKSLAILLHVLGLPLLGYLRASSFQSMGGWMLFTIDLYTFLALPLFCLHSFGGLVRDDLQEDTACYILTRPIRRWQFLVGQYTCQCLWTCIIVALTYLAFGSMWWLQEIEGWLPVMLGLMSVAVPAILVYGAISSLMGLLARKYLVLGLIYGCVIEFGVGQIPTNLHSLSMTHHLKDLLALHPEIGAHLVRDSAQPWLSLLMLAMATLISLGVGCLLFTHREYLQAEDMSR